MIRPITPIGGFRLLGHMGPMVTNHSQCLWLIYGLIRDSVLFQTVQHMVCK